ncbi:MAG: class I SAM-dependent methyltransferase [Candidatus Dadabacteria bacterium]|nr:class I SAM-dependent methyltransferase [Candidatus Dadabacteria bacterium]
MDWNVTDYERNASYVWQRAGEVLDLLAPRAGEVILDVGCGTGALMSKIAESGCEVVGVDSSPEMVSAAREKGLDARVVDAQCMEFSNQFDAVFSNASLHWMPDSNAVLSNVHKALKPGGRFCAEFGAKNNAQTIIDALYEQLQKFNLNGDDYKPWDFPAGEDYRRRLERNGFEIIELTVADRITPLPTDVAGWLKTFAGPFLRDIPPNRRDEVITAAADKAGRKLKTGDGKWVVDYTRLRFLARKR